MIWCDYDDSDYDDGGGGDGGGGGGGGGGDGVGGSGDSLKEIKFVHRVRGYMKGSVLLERKGDQHDFSWNPKKILQKG